MDRTWNKVRSREGMIEIDKYIGKVRTMCIHTGCEKERVGMDQRKEFVRETKAFMKTNRKEGIV